MKSLTEVPLAALHESFSVKVKNQTLNDPFLHKHEAYELTFLPKVRALRFIGDSVKEIHEDELVLLAPNLLHCWHIVAAKELVIPALVVHFKEDFMGELFFKSPELDDFRCILQLAKRGIKFNSKQQEILLPAMKELGVMQGLRRLIQLLKIFELITGFDPADFQYMTSANYREIYSENDYQNINKIIDFVQKSFSHRITLDQAAHLAHLSTSAFCRYFKKCTGKTFTGFVKEVRISHACYLLKHSLHSIYEVSFYCGYNNMANFNRQFRQVTQHSPKEYQQLYKFDSIKNISNQEK